MWASTAKRLFRYEDGKIYWKKTGKEAGKLHKSGFWLIYPYKNTESYISRGKVVWRLHNENDGIVGNNHGWIWHKDGNKKNDRIENLELLSDKEFYKRKGIPHA